MLLLCFASSLCFSVSLDSGVQGQLHTVAAAHPAKDLTCCSLDLSIVVGPVSTKSWRAATNKAIRLRFGTFDFTSITPAND